MKRENGRRDRGSIIERKGAVWARMDYTDERGRRRSATRKAANRTEAKRLLAEMLREFDERGERALAGDRVTFADYGAWYAERYLVEAEYVDGRRVRGLRSVASARSYLQALLDAFGKKRLRAISHADLEQFRADRLATPTKRGGGRAIASVNRELGLLRRMFAVAVRDGLLGRSPFLAGDGLISPAHERQRDRILTWDEEAALLTACDGPKRAHLRPILVCALDTGMRQGEIFSLRWSDVDFVQRLITIKAHNTKTERERVVALTERLAEELEQVRRYATGDTEDLVFGISSNVTRSFRTVCRETKLDDLRFHDLRHTAATRLVAAGIDLPTVGRVLGHTQPATTYRYVNLTLESARRAAGALGDSMPPQVTQKVTQSPATTSDNRQRAVRVRKS